ncbi:hypothetical protein ACTFIY_011011 [Dictyostelium cf. discoideum]
MKLISLLITFLLAKLIYSQRNPSTLKFTFQVYDQFPGYNNNFENNGNFMRVIGLIKSTLNSKTRVPELVSNATGGLNDPNLPGQNSPLSLDLILTYDTTRNIYVYNNQNFFPIDNKGFDVDPAKRIYSNGGKIYHNYHFCMKMNNVFTYSGFEVFNFQGNDDVWVFINNKLVIDLGGVHGPISASVDTKTLGYFYKFDLFFCDRQTVQIIGSYIIKCKPSSNPCISNQCNSTNGQCYETQIPGDICDCGCNIQENKCEVSWCTPQGICQSKFKSEIDDNNSCTLDSCDPCTGIISHITAPQCLSCNQCSN